MSLDISAKTIEPIRMTYSHIARRIGEGKPASRYQEATFDIQPTANFQYRPLWDKEHEIYDAGRTTIVMEDWYAFSDPRQYYYGVYTQTRAKQQDNVDNNFKFVEARGLVENLPTDVRDKVLTCLMPLRHTEWGANMNNCAITDMGYGVAITQATMFNSMDRLGLAQYITRMGLLLSENDTTILDVAKSAWLEDEIWQGLRHAVEDTFVLDDWFEVLVAQNIVMDGMIYPLIFGELVDDLVARNGAAIGMMTDFQNQWAKETVRWTDALLKVTAAESDENKKHLTRWIEQWLERIHQALVPLANAAFDGDGESRLENVKKALTERVNKQGLEVSS